MMKLAYTFKDDVLFKKLFVDHPELLKRLVSVMLAIPLTSIEEFVIANPEIPPEIIGDKFCRIDINMMLNGMHVNLEIQVHDDHDFDKRLLYYWAREYSSALKEGGHYIDLPTTIIISIVAFKMFVCEEYYSRFQALEVTRRERLSEALDIHVCELSKLPENVSADDKRELWLKLFDAETEEDLLKIEMLEVPEMTQAINAYRRVTVSPEFLSLQRMRDDARHNEASALYNAELRGEHRGKLQSAIEAISRGITDADIVAAIGGFDKERANELIRQYT